MIQAVFGLLNVTYLRQLFRIDSSEFAYAMAALFGVLETLHHLHLPLLSVEVMEDENGEWQALEVAPEQGSARARKKHKEEES